MIRMETICGATNAFSMDYPGLKMDLLSSMTSFKLYYSLLMTSLSELAYEWRTWYLAAVGVAEKDISRLGLLQC